MNLKHLGDALDFWKGALIELLRDELRELHVLPMFTDHDVAAAWDSARLELYAGLLHVDVSRILRRQISFATSARPEYFEDLGIRTDVDLFLDPDTGIARARRDRRHVRRDEIQRLLPNGSGRVVLVYQHRIREKDWLNTCLRGVLKCSPLAGCHAFGYCAGSVSMVFISRETCRLAGMHQVLHDFASPLPASLRRVTAIIPWTPCSP